MNPPFYLFGFGPHRRKILYQAGQLRDALTGEVLFTFAIADERIQPDAYRVTLTCRDGSGAVITEDETGVQLTQHGNSVYLTQSPVRLPRFDGKRHAPLLRALHGELLINIMPCGPVPNLWTYPRPWYRDAAMMALCFAATNNLDLIAPWINGLTQPYDYNNKGVAEADNLGQALFLISLVSNASHPLVSKILNEVPKYLRGNHICGLSDYAEHPVYQTKWLKYGLRALNLPDPYTIPAVPDSYSALFWMDFRDQHVAYPRFDAEHLAKWPYLNIAEAHFYNDPIPLPALTYPLTREAEASEANYWRMSLVGQNYITQRLAVPHTWHAAELFLYLLDPHTPA